LRTNLLAVQNGLDGSTGLLRVAAAGSDATGTFRLTVTNSFYSGTGFLCPDCERADGTVATAQDEARLFALRPHPELVQSEIQGHTDDTGTPLRNLRLS
jgi:hypothetical protein